jgi:hypothetical protein
MLTLIVLAHAATAGDLVTVVGLEADSALFVCDPSESYVEHLYPEQDSGEVECAVVRDADRGRVRARRSPTLQMTPFATFDTESAYAWAEQEAFSVLVAGGVPEEQIGRLTARAMNMDSNDGSIEPQTVGIVVWVERSVDGYRVPGHGARVHFEVNGALREVEATWPALAWNPEPYAADTVCAGRSLEEWVANAASGESVSQLEIEDIIYAEEYRVGESVDAVVGPLVSYLWDGGLFSKRFERTCSEAG